MVLKMQNELGVDALDKTLGLEHVPVSLSVISDFANQFLIMI